MCLVRCITYASLPSADHRGSVRLVGWF